MRIVGVMVVRNEEDVVEASIRHNLRVLDALVVVDHASTDATPAILASLVAEGLPIQLSRDDALGALSPHALATPLRQAVAAGADVAIPLEADEFVRLPSREAFERSVRDAGEAATLAIAVQTFAPDFASGAGLPERLRQAKRRRPDASGAVKVVATRHASGGSGASSASTTLPESTIAIARVPVRSVDQYVAKIAIGYLSGLLATPPVPDADNPYRDAYAEIVAGHAPTRDRLESVALNFGVPVERRLPPGPANWIDDPLLADVELRHTPVKPAAPLARVLAFGERVAAEVARTTGGL